MPEYLLFAGYLFLFSWLVTRVKFFTRCGLSKSQLVIIFLLKVLAGIFYGWIGIYYGGHAKMWDTWIFHRFSMYEYELLLTDPREYLGNLFRNSYDEGLTRFFESEGSYWNDLKGSIFIKLLSVFNVFSLGHYYVNVIFYSFLSLFGIVGFFRVVTDLIPGRKLLILSALLLAPSFLYWTSGIHKEGMIFTGIALCLYSIYFAHKEKRFTAGKITALITGLLMVLTLRNFLIVLLVPALLTWVTANRFPAKTKQIFAGAYLLYILFFFTAGSISPKLDFPAAVANKQQEFLKRTGRATVAVQLLEPTAAGFLKNSGQAISLSMLRPYPTDVHNLLSLVSAAEINLLLLLLILFLWKREKGLFSDPFWYCCLFFAISVLLSIGYSNNNIGAIVRYRSILVPMLAVPLLTGTDWAYYKRKLFGKSN